MTLRTLGFLGFLLALRAGPVLAQVDPNDRIRSAVDAVVKPLMAKDQIPGMAVGIVFEGKPYIFNYGVASKQSGEPVSDRTLFELGSISKTFTATLAAYAEVSGYLSLNDPIEKYLPALAGTPFGAVPLYHLGTHTPGGLPLQVPGSIHTETEFLHFLRDWRPAHPPGTFRTYSNPGIGTLGLVAAVSIGQDFTTLLEQHLFLLLGMQTTYLHVPTRAAADYAVGYTQDGTPARVAPGVLDAETYGVKTTALDLVHFVQANLGETIIQPSLLQALRSTHRGYFQDGAMTQGLIWEQYAYPVTLADLLAGNSPNVIYQPTPVIPIQPVMAPRDDVWINKTGSTNGFGDYVAYVPQKRLGVVLLANRNYPISERVTAAFEILRSLGSGL